MEIGVREAKNKLSKYLKQVKQGESIVITEHGVPIDEFLVPQKSLQEIWPSVKNNHEPFNEIARQFKVSALVAARRALNLHLINKERFFKFYNSYKEDERRKASGDDTGGNFYDTQRLRVGKRFAAAVVTAVREKKISHLEAYRLTGLYGYTFDKFIASLGLRGSH